jgi:hypothetical protein
MRPVAVSQFPVVIVLSATIILAALAVLPGCFSYTSDTPLVTVGDKSYGGGYSRPELSNYPAGPCRDELTKALDRIDKLQNDLAKCKADRQKDKDKWDAAKDKLERERDMYKKQLDNLPKG